MGFNDYGRTPNVWRPSEVPYPSREALNLTHKSGTDETDDSQRLPLGWHLVFDSWNTDPDGFCTRSTSYETAVDLILIPPSPLVCVIAHLSASAYGGPQNANYRLSIPSAGDTMNPLSNSFSVANGQTRRACLVSRLVPLLTTTKCVQNERWALLLEDGVNNAGFASGGIFGSLTSSAPPATLFPASDVGMRLSLSITPSAGTGNGTVSCSRLRVWSVWTI